GGPGSVLRSDRVADDQGARSVRRRREHRADHRNDGETDQNARRDTHLQTSAALLPKTRTIATSRWFLSANRTCRPLCWATRLPAGLVHGRYRHRDRGHHRTGGISTSSAAAVLAEFPDAVRRARAHPMDGSESSLPVVLLELRVAGEFPRHW